MISYNPKFLDNINIFNKEEINLLEKLNKEFSLNNFLTNKSYIDKFGLDFIHTSAQIEGNTYDRFDTITLLEHGRTAGGKKYSDAKMILNLKEAYDLLIVKDLNVSKETLKDIHYILSNEMLRDNERAIPRDEEVIITLCDYVPLSSKEKLDTELNYLFKKYEEIENPYNKAIYLHNNLAYLQYFKDCNKRTARVMLNISLKSNNKMIYIPTGDNISIYLKAITSYYETGKYDTFKEHFINSYQNIIDKIKFVKQVSNQDFKREEVKQSPKSNYQPRNKDKNNDKDILTESDKSQER